MRRMTDDIAFLLSDVARLLRRRDPADRRAWNIFLTERSRPLLAQLRVVADRVVGAAMEGVDDADRRRLAQTLDRIRGNLAEVDGQELAHG